MRLLVVSESPLQVCGNRYFAVDPWVRFIQHLAKSGPQVTLLAPTLSVDRPSGDSWWLDTESLAIEHHDPYHSYEGFVRLWLRRNRHWRRCFEALISAHDLVAIRLPSPSLSLIMRAAARCEKPAVLLVAGDLAAQSDRLRSSTGLRRLVYQVVVNALVRQEIRYGRQAAAVFAYSSTLAERHRGADVRMMRTPHLHAGDFVLREDTCGSEVIRLLRVCWLLPSKGLESLIDAVAQLTDRGVKVRLTLVGRERAEGYQRSLEARVRDLGLEGVVEFRGWVPFDRMADEYLASDVQVISSLAEGTPRCMVEGMARGLPLVSTNVDGCGDYLEDGRTALLVPPGSPSALADAIERVIRDGALRRRLIANGYTLARSATFEVLGAAFRKELELMAQPPLPGMREVAHAQQPHAS